MSDERPRGPNALATHCAETIPIIEARIARLTDKREIKEARRHLKLVRDMKRWCESRAGYVKPVKGKA